MKKVLSCILSFMPLLLIAFVVIAFMVASIFIGEGNMSTPENIAMICLMLVAVVAVILTFVLMIVYIVKAFKNPDLSTGMKVLWCALLYFFNLLIYPVFWFMYIRKE